VLERVNVWHLGDGWVVVENEKKAKWYMEDENLYLLQLYFERYEMA